MFWFEMKCDASFGTLIKVYFIVLLIRIVWLQPVAAPEIFVNGVMQKFKHKFKNKIERE